MSIFIILIIIIIIRLLLLWLLIIIIIIRPIISLLLWLYYVFILSSVVSISWFPSSSRAPEPCPGPVRGLPSEHLGALPHARGRRVVARAVPTVRRVPPAAQQHVLLQRHEALLQGGLPTVRSTHTFSPTPFMLI